MNNWWSCTNDIKSIKNQDRKKLFLCCFQNNETIFFKLSNISFQVIILQLLDFFLHKIVFMSRQTSQKLHTVHSKTKTECISFFATIWWHLRVDCVCNERVEKTINYFKDFKSFEAQKIMLEKLEKKIKSQLYWNSNKKYMR